jgi:RHS repeat-associated protein
MNQTDGNANVVASYDQDAYGNMISNMTTGQWASSISGRHLTTKEADADAGLYYFWQRWYEPGGGRFISKSSYLPQYEHPYTYAAGDPIGKSDPTGEWVRPALCIGCIAATGGGQIAGCLAGCSGAQDYWECVSTCLYQIGDSEEVCTSLAICGILCNLPLPDPTHPGKDYDWDPDHGHYDKNTCKDECPHVHDWKPRHPGDPKYPGDYRDKDGRRPCFGEKPLFNPCKPRHRG